MKVSDFSFDLPEELIARTPAEDRTGSRLMVLDGVSGNIEHRQFSALPALLRRGDLLVFNNTRVIAARLFAVKVETGGAVELLVERVLDGGHVLAHLRASKTPKPGVRLGLLDEEGEIVCEVDVVARQAGAGLFELAFPASHSPFEVMEQIGHVPLPPYIDRPDDNADKHRYQTVYAQHDGAVAAPTAGLHFDETLLTALTDMGVETAFVTLHVGAGTFQNIRVEDVRDHQMHFERIEVLADVAAQINRAHADGRRVIAVGTTSMRTLESAVGAEGVEACARETNLFIYPGYRFQAVDALITNFHLSRSSLLMLVSAFADTTRVLSAYQAAIRERYRFFSYGDAMLVTGSQIPRLKEIL